MIKSKQSKNLFVGAILAICGLVFMFNYSAALANGTTYYLDCAGGSDSNNGTSSSSAWLTIGKVNSTVFAPGDSVLLKRGVACSGSLQPQGSGNASAVITLADYGTGALPIVDGGTNQATIKLFNQQYWEIRNIEARNGTTWGILVNGSGTTVLNHIHITNTVVHDVMNGTATDKYQGLVVVGYNFAQQFNDVVIDGVTAYNTNMWAGIVVTGKGYKLQPTRSTNVTVRNSTVYNTYGDGIIVFSSNNVLMEHNLAYNTGNAPTATIGTPNAIWTWDCGNCLVQFNEAYLNHSPSYDGGAYDIDYYSSDTTIQYNYAHDNDGYCAAIFATDGTVTNGIIRYNVCSNNARKASDATDRNAELYIAVWSNGYISGAQIYNNTFYWNPANATLHYAIASYDLYHCCNFIGTNIIMNNIVYASNPNLVKLVVNKFLTLDNNLYWYTGTGSPTFIWGTKSSSGFSAFQTASLQEAHGIYADPLLTSPTYHANGFPVAAFNLQNGSPAIDHGANLVSLGYTSSMGSRDFFGNAIPAGSAYDIGAYESGGGGVTPTNTPTIQPPTNTPSGPTPTPTIQPPTNTPSGAPAMHVQSTITTDVNGTPKNAFLKGDVVYYRAQIVDQTGAAVSGASVTTTINQPSGSLWKTYTATTDANGWAMFQQNTVGGSAVGTYTITVTGVTKSGVTYNASANVDSTQQFTLS